MKTIMCPFSNYHEMANQEGTDFYIDLKKQCLVTDEMEKFEELLPTPYRQDLYPKGQALEDYILQNGIDMSEWCAKNQIEIKFNA